MSLLPAKSIESVDGELSFVDICIFQAMGSYCLFTFAYFKPFLGLKYTAGLDWSNKSVEPMNFDFASKLYGS